MSHRREDLTVQHPKQRLVLLEQWLNTRKTLLSSYYELVGMKPKVTKPKSISEKKLISFCHHLVEYMFSGHFHVFHYILEKAEKEAHSTLEESTKIHYQIKNNTNKIMDFHDKYTESKIELNEIHNIRQDLSMIGECLATRFSLEDKLVKTGFSDNQG